MAKKLSDRDILSILDQEKKSALSYSSEIAADRKKALNYYMGEPRGDEIEGQSRVVSSDVQDTVEWILPSLIRTFTAGGEVVRFDPVGPEDEDEAQQKTRACNHVFWQQNDGFLLMYTNFKDALLQKTGVFKYYWTETPEICEERYDGQTIEQLAMLLGDNAEVVEQEQRIETIVDPSLGIMEQVEVYDVVIRKTETNKKVEICCVPPEEYLISRESYSRKEARFEGHRTLKTRSQLLEMGFDKSIVESLPKAGTNSDDDEGQRYTRFKDLVDDDNAGNDPANDLIWLLEGYVNIDVDGDGIAEKWQVFEAGNHILKKTRWYTRNPFAITCPILMSHRVIGRSLADLTFDIQDIKTALMRGFLNNMYLSNMPRIGVDAENVEIADLLVHRPGGLVRTKNGMPPAQALMPFQVPNMAAPILQAVEQVDMMRETRTGITRYSQGLDPDSLNKTATGFRGIMDASQQRVELVARVFAETGVKDLFVGIAELLQKHQDVPMNIRLNGKMIQIDPQSWKHKQNVTVEVGLGTGSKDAVAAALIQILDIQKQSMELGSVLADETKIYNTLDKLVIAAGLKNVATYFNDPASPEMQQKRQQIDDAKASQPDPYMAAEQMKAESRMQETMMKLQQQSQQMQYQMQMQMQQFMMEMQEKQAARDQQFLEKMTEFELKYKQNVPGAAV